MRSQRSIGRKTTEKIKGYEGRTIWRVDEEEAERMLDGGTNKLYTLYEICDEAWFYQNSKDKENGGMAGEYRKKFSFLIEEIYPYVYVPFVSEGEMVNVYPTNVVYALASYIIKKSFFLYLLFDLFLEKDQGKELARKYLEDKGLWKLTVTDGNTTLGLGDWARLGDWIKSGDCIDYVLSTDGWGYVTTEGEEVTYCSYN